MDTLFHKEALFNIIIYHTRCLTLSEGLVDRVGILIMRICSPIQSKSSRSSWPLLRPSLGFGQGSTALLTIELYVFDIGFFFVVVFYFLFFFFFQSFKFTWTTTDALFGTKDTKIIKGQSLIRFLFQLNEKKINATQIYALSYLFHGKYILGAISIVFLVKKPFQNGAILFSGVLRSQDTVTFGLPAPMDYARWLCDGPTLPKIKG